MDSKENMVSTVIGLVTAILTGAIPGVNLIDAIYSNIFMEELPDYFSYGFSSVGLFTLLYSFVYTLVISPLYCTVGRTPPSITIFSRPSKEDLVYVPFIYLTYLWTIWYYGILSYQTALYGVFVVLLPIIYRFIIYTIDYLLERYRSSCNYYIELFVLSVIVLVPLTVVYIMVVESLIS